MLLLQATVPFRLGWALSFSSWNLSVDTLPIPRSALVMWGRWLFIVLESTIRGLVGMVPFVLGWVNAVVKIRIAGGVEILNHFGFFFWLVMCFVSLENFRHCNLWTSFRFLRSIATIEFEWIRDRLAAHESTIAWLLVTHNYKNKLNKNTKH